MTVSSSTATCRPSDQTSRYATAVCSHITHQCPGACQPTDPRHVMGHVHSLTTSWAQMFSVAKPPTGAPHSWRSRGQQPQHTSETDKRHSASWCETSKPSADTAGMSLKLILSRVLRAGSSSCAPKFQ